MLLFETPDASLTYHQASGFMQLRYQAASLSGGFAVAYARALALMQHHHVDKLLLDLERNALPTDNEAQLLEPLRWAFPTPRKRPVLVAAVLSEKQYHDQIGNYTPGTGGHVAPAQVEFNYFTSHRDAAAWLRDN